uniref:Tudor domain-containing protein n=1 Tax=Anoplophora glabripennis TaxID=217634 RepID=V5H027_ANOGL
MYRTEMGDNPNRNCLYVTNFGGDVDRRKLLTEFRKFGDVRKLYLDPLGEFAKVFFIDRQSAEAAVRALQNSVLNWQVTFDTWQNNSKTSNMAHYGDDYEDDDFSENFDYCNVHGQPLVVLQADSGDLYVNLKDIRKTGFALFRRDTFDSVLVDNRQIGKEFELHLLSEAKNYILKNRVASIDEDQILKTIERCKNKLLGGTAGNNFGIGRSVSQSSNTITVTSNVHESEAIAPLLSESVPQRPPRTLPNNFMPTQVHRGDKQKGLNTQNQQQSNRGRRDNSRYNGFKGSNSSPKTEESFNSGSSSDTKDNVRKSGGFESGNKQRSPKERKEELTRVTFELKTAYDVTVSYKEEKENICWVQDKRYAKELEEVIIKVNEVADVLEPINPVLGRLVIAEYDGAWNRGRVSSVDPLIVTFIDYGNKNPVDLVKALPDSLKTIPMLANRIAIDSNDKHLVVKEFTDLKIFVKQKYDKGTYVVSLLINNGQKVNEDPSSLKPSERSSSVSKNIPDVLCEKPSPSEEPPETPKQKTYCVIPKPSTDLHNGDMVMLVDVDTNKFLVRTKECAVKSKTINDYIKNLDKMPLTNVKVGQLVLSSKDGFAGLFRAVVVKLDNDLIVTVKYIDFPGEADLSVKSLRNIDDFLAAEPATILVTKEFKGLEDMNEEAAEYVSTICQNRGKFKVILSGDNFDLQATDGSLLSQTLQDFKTPKPVLVEEPAFVPEASKKPIETEEIKTPAANDEKVLYDEMDWIKIEPGTYSLMCYCVQDIDDITFLSSTGEVIGYLETITSVMPTDEVPYKPKASEMCLVSYKGPEDDEATWYRAVVLSEEEDKYTISFVDFGNIECTKSENIRRFPANLKDIPILGIGCSCTGLPKKQQIVDRLKQLISEGTQVDVVVKGLDGLKYQIEMPEIYKQLKAENLF